MSENTRIVKDATCTFCGCVCDDMDLTVEEQPHHQGQERLRAGQGLVQGSRDRDRPVASSRAAKPALRRGDRGGRADPGQGALSDHLRPVRHDLRGAARGGRDRRLDRRHHRHHDVGLPRALGHGVPGRRRSRLARWARSSNRADLIMFWGGNPAECHPRHFTNYSLMPKGMFLPNGRKDRTVVLVDVRRTPSAPAADIFIQIKPRQRFRGALGAAGAGQGPSAIDPAIEADDRRAAGDAGRPDGAHEALPVRRALLRHGPDDDPRQALQQRGAARARRRPERSTPASSPSRSAATATSPAPTTSSPGRPAIRSAST